MKRFNYGLTAATIAALALWTGFSTARSQTATSSAVQQIHPVAAKDDESSYRQIFDGKTLNGWDGDPKYWRVEDGCLVGEVTPATLLDHNNFIIWRGGTPGDFELKVAYRISSRGNSGINYRSVEVPGVPYAMRGYQADIDGEERMPETKAGVRYAGQNYEERGRTFLAELGQLTHITSGGIAEVIAPLGDPKELQKYVKSGDWNDYHLIIRNNVLIHILNGHLTSLVIDDDATNRRSDGLIGVQVHVGPPMKVEYRWFRIKNL